MKSIQTSGVPVTDWQPGALTSFCDELLRAFAETIEVAEPTSPLGLAKQQLGDRYYAIAHAALRRHSARLAFKDANTALAVLANPEDPRLIAQILTELVRELLDAAARKGRAA